MIRLPTLGGPNNLWGQILSGITSAGAFAAFMSTFSGLLVSMSGALAHDTYGKMLRPNASPASCLVAFKVSAVLIGAISIGLSFLVESFDIALMVGWAFAIAACSYFPLLLLGAWWKGLTKVVAGGGMPVGGLMALGSIVFTMLIDKKVITHEVSPLTRSLLEQPAIWGVPLSITRMVVLSRLTPSLIPTDINLKMLRLHAPEELGLSKNYIDHQGTGRPSIPDGRLRPDPAFLPTRTPRRRSILDQSWVLTRPALGKFFPACSFALKIKSA